ncbi:DUF3306 domain-containing protein [Schlegelella sp. S2-27]|uniref:DUF3306 domain-containing protein n=1 Tax=Caldimonas mangrovi TaxID=2944811 RepID=A0ABT0YJG5_9BURK|nr:DUF3306 domain-containing protein [Caldimonas mangrovi]MCM5678867.1 DUF3306 domain-containing protein [Caldimonas mangrovi]
MADESFFSRWSRRKAEAREEAEPAAPPAVEAPADDAPVDAPPPEPPPTMDDVARLTHQSDYSRFVSRGVDDDVKRAAMKKLFSDPHFNQMDGLDVYIDDYSRPDPIPLAMLRQMTQARMLGLFQDEPSGDAPAAGSSSGAATPNVSESSTPHDTAPADAAGAAVPHDENPAVQLQPDDAAGRPGPDQGAGR